MEKKFLHKPMSQNHFHFLKEPQVFRRSEERKGDYEKTGFGLVAKDIMKRMYG